MATQSYYHAARLQARHESVLVRRWLADKGLAGEPLRGVSAWEGKWLAEHEQAELQAMFEQARRKTELTLVPME